ncbi:MAG: malonyl-CoA O-methyltransferase [Bacteroidia bacterium]|jgi:malonyl-CoA O-methyltransferase
MRLYRERLAAHHGDAKELVLLHGWGASSECWRSALPLLRRHFNVTLIDLPGHGNSEGAADSPEDFIADLLPLLPVKALYLGWSLGAMLATRLAAEQPARVEALMSVAANASFVERAGWPQAMARPEYEDFCARFESNPAKALRRFELLQWQGDIGAPSRTHQPALMQRDSQGRMLRWLDEIDNRAAIGRISCPLLSVFGEHDTLVPLACAESISVLNAKIEINIIVGAAHIPFLSQGEGFWLPVLDFCRRHSFIKDAQLPGQLNKRSVADSFSRAAGSYDSVAELQRRVADKLADALPAFRDLRILDMGSGTGYSLPALRPIANELIALDIAEGMLRYTRAQPERRADLWLCGDAEALPLKDDSVDCIFSSLAVQWCENSCALFSEIHRVLKPGGRVLLSTLGPSTLNELRGAWQSVDERSHVNQFIDQGILTSAIEASGLQQISWEEHWEALHYKELRELTGELKKLGAHNLNAGRPGGLTGKQALRRFVAGYEQFRDTHGMLPATYQVWYLELHKPELNFG